MPFGVSLIIGLFGLAVVIGGVLFTGLTLALFSSSFSDPNRSPIDYLLGIPVVVLFLLTIMGPQDIPPWQSPTGKYIFPVFMLFGMTLTGEIGGVLRETKNSEDTTQC